MALLASFGRGGGPQRSLYGPWVKGPLVGPVHEEVRVVTESSALKFFHDLVGPSFETVRADHVPDEEGPSSVMRRRLLRRAGLHQELQGRLVTPERPRGVQLGHQRQEEHLRLHIEQVLPGRKVEEGVLHRVVVEGALEVPD